MSTSIKHYITDEDVININDLVSELAVILRKFEIDLNPYQDDRMKSLRVPYNTL